MKKFKGTVHLTCDVHFFVTGEGEDSDDFRENMEAQVLENLQHYIETWVDEADWDADTYNVYEITEP